MKDRTIGWLLDNLRELKDRTVVIVTHRSAALEKCDRVFRFSEGKILEYGKKVTKGWRKEA